MQTTSPSKNPRRTLLPRIAASDAEIENCFAAMRELRPHLKAEEFPGRVRRQMAQGYRLLYLELEGRVATLAGFRIYDLLYCGKTLYIDDFVTHSEFRKKGLGDIVFQRVIDIAREEGCETLTLDSGPGRKDAHRFYLNQGLTINSLHFGMDLTK